MNIKEFKKELSKLSGIDFFNPKYRELFKRYFEDKPDDAEEVEEAKAADAITDEAVTETAEEVVEDIQADQAADSAGGIPDYTETAKYEEELAEAVEADQEADSNVQEVEADNKPEQTAEEKELAKVIGDDSDPESETEEAEAELPTEAEAEQTPVDISEELLTTKLELELVRAGIREDRLETAKRLFMPEFKASSGNVESLRELIAKYPEWIGKKGGAQGFGMPLGDKTGVLSNEEKALKSLGIDPKIK